MSADHRLRAPASLAGVVVLAVLLGLVLRRLPGGQSAAADVVASTAPVEVDEFNAGVHLFEGATPSESARAAAAYLRRHPEERVVSATSAGSTGTTWRGLFVFTERAAGAR